MLNGYSKAKLVDLARDLFDKIPEKDVVSWGTIVDASIQADRLVEALALYCAMLSAGLRPNDVMIVDLVSGCGVDRLVWLSGVQPNEITMVSVLSAIASLGALREAKWAHEYISNNSIPLNDNLTAALIDVYAKCGSISNALDVFNSVRLKVTSVSPWNAIICGLARHGHATLSLRMFEDLEKNGIQPNSITFIGVLTACCHAGLVEAGETHFESMKNVYKIHPNIKHYGCMVDLLGRAG